MVFRILKEKIQTNLIRDDYNINTTLEKMKTNIKDAEYETLSTMTVKNKTITNETEEVLSIN